MNLKEAVEKSMKVNIGRIIDTLCMESNINFLAEGCGYEAIRNSPFIFKALTGKNIGYYSIMEYARYIAPYCDENEKIIVITRGGKKLDPKVKMIMEICSLMGIEYQLIVTGRVGEVTDVRGKFEPIEIGLENELSNPIHFLAANTITVRIAAEMGRREGWTKRAGNIIMDIEEIINEPLKVGEEFEELLKKIFEGDVVIIADPIIYGLAREICWELNINIRTRLQTYMIGEDIRMFKGKKTEEYIIFTTEIQEDLARQIGNYYKLREGKVMMITVKGEPLTATLKLGIPIFTEILRKLKVERKEKKW
ncbi:MAG: hypothetical protein J7J22_01570 [Candidatus Verstraetearchaeota archaeon]|nr:hypothetical protein [Candidatus Verstraetearchaeota archaeon]